jgi:hypothetical protein
MPGLSGSSSAVRWLAGIAASVVSWGGTQQCWAQWGGLGNSCRDKHWHWHEARNQREARHASSGLGPHPIPAVSDVTAGPNLKSANQVLCEKGPLHRAN